MKSLVRTIACLVGSAALLSLSGCASLGAKPWDRAILARNTMQLDRNGVESALDDHIYFSKEASTGGRGIGGGGCGCN